jgi:hypothetical protein
MTRMVEPYAPMSLRKLAEHLARTGDEPIRRKLLLEFLEEYRWEPLPGRLRLLDDEPARTGDERWDVLLAAVADHLASCDGGSEPSWAEDRSLGQWWFPDDTPFARADALVRAPAAFRRRGVFIAEHDLARA